MECLKLTMVLIWCKTILIHVYTWSIFLCWWQNIFRHFFNADGTNYALSRPASQSSTHHGLVAGKAVDGISDDESSISHTLDGDYHPWWKVELAYPIWVTHVEITNRLDWGKKFFIQLGTNREWCINTVKDFLLLFWCFTQLRIKRGGGCIPKITW